MFRTMMVVFSVATVLPAHAAPTFEKLFFIQRSKNANEVHYDARVNADGTLDRTDPISGYWIDNAANGSRKPISLIQKIAYGWSVEPESNGTYALKLKALPDRRLTLGRVNGRWRVRLDIGGRQAFLHHLYVATDESGVMPKVLSIELFGELPGSGAAVQEHIVKS